MFKQATAVNNKQKDFFFWDYAASLPRAEPVVAKLGNKVKVEIVVLQCL